MPFTKESMKEFFSDSDLNRGRRYYQMGRLRGVKLYDDEADGAIFPHMECMVRGNSGTYEVNVSIMENHIVGYCTCPQFARAHSCKHMSAALYYYCDACNRETEKTAKNSSAKPGTDAAAAFLLKSYVDMAGREQTERKASLEPTLVVQERGYPNITFKAGYERMYIVRNLESFARNMHSGATVEYGKNLTLRHARECFDTQSQAIIDIFMDEFPQFRGMSQSALYMGYDAMYSPLRYNKKEICITGNGFERLFDLLEGQSIPCEGSHNPIKFVTRDPWIKMKLHPTPGGAELCWEAEDDAHFFGNDKCLYAITDTEIVRCSEAFRKRLRPLLNSTSPKMHIGQKDLPTFCSCVLPELGTLVEVEDGGGILPQYTPEECVPCYYFDLQTGLGLVCETRFQYGDIKISAQTPPSVSAGIKRNARAEAEAARPMERWLKPANIGGVWHLEGEDDIMEFLTDHLEDFHRLGEVYVSEQLRAKRVSLSSHPSVGVSVSGGMLTLNIDTGEFPPEELEALYSSLLHKKRFHKLRDGRYLPLDGSAYEKLAELAHMTQLTEKDLKNGQVVMPAFRGLYLDKVLEDSEGIAVHRDTGLKSMVRAFKSVADSDYQVPPSLENVLRPYQKLGFQWLKTLEANGFGGILADEMGLGKTVQVIAYLLTVPRQETGAPSLIVCPASLVLNWADELARFAPTLRPLVLVGNAAERRAQLESPEAENADVWVTSYDLLKRDEAKYTEQQFYCCVLDEAQNIKNQSTLISKTVKMLLSKQRFVLTGTPIENRLSELWNLFDFLMPGYLFSHGAFIKKLEKPIVQSDDPTASRQLGLLVQPFLLRRLKKDVLKELPDKIEHLRKVALSDEERRVYQAAAWEAKKAVEQTQEKLQMLALLTRLRQICCDPALCFENYQGPNSKLDACVELCVSMAANGHRILLFSQFTTMLDRIRERLTEQGVSSFTLEGATPKEKRARLVKEFGAGAASVFLISLKAGGTGLNLTSADVVIHYDPWWNLAAQNQATDRAHRIGQQAHVQVYKLIAQGTIEEKIVKLQEKKATLMDTVTEGGGGEPLSKNEILALLDED